MSKMSKEFKKYYPFTNVTRAMVNEDRPIEVVERFYESLSTTGIAVLYIPDLSLALNALKKNADIILATTIEFGQPGSTHAITLVKKGTDFYFFDPNGAVTVVDPLKYFYGTRYFVTDDLMSVFRKNGINFNYEGTKQGIQVYGSPDAKNSIYINSGGYCMFYNHLFIKHIVKHWPTVDIKSIINYDYSQGLNIFPSKKTLPGLSKDIIDSVMATLSGYDDSSFR